MARTKGTLSLSSNIEPSMNAPLDARLVVNTVADLTASGSFPYFYEGMVVSCKGNRKLYQLVGNDPTASANWSEVGSGGGSNVSVTQILSTGTKIATITVDDTPTDLYAPSGGGGGGGSATNYSTTEQEIGTWIDGGTLYSIVAPNVSVDMGGSTGDISSTPQNLKSYTAVTAGDYVFTSMTGNTNCGNNEGFIGFYKNGVQIATRQLPTGQTVSLSDVNVSLEVGDVVATKFEFIGSHTCRATLTASLLPTVASGASIKFKKTTVDTLYNYFEYTKPST